MHVCRRVQQALQPALLLVTLLYSQPKKDMAIGMHGNINEPQATPGCPFPPMAALTAKIGIFGVDRIRSASVQPDFPRPLLAESVMGRKAAD
ncbi:hypothetical protein MCOR24_006653 [Pyricularia oryzae]|nr:hypothetical protein MCOR24_006653 [Pyricularia oryzae]